MKKLSLTAALGAIAAVALPSFALAQADTPREFPSPGQIVAEAPASEWVRIAPEDLLVMDLAPDRDGNARRVVIQLMPAPFSQGWIGNIRTLAAAHWWDGTSVNRVQDNYVVQWGDASEKKPLPAGLVTVPESDYVTFGNWHYGRSLSGLVSEGNALFNSPPGTPPAPILDKQWDVYAPRVGFEDGWPVAWQQALAWPVHCYGMVGVGRNLSPDTGTGAELYTVIGHAPRHLDRNIALVGRVIEGMENLSSLPRGTGDLGFYEDDAQRIAIASVRIAADLAKEKQPQFEYLSTAGETFARYTYLRANRHDPFFNVAAGGADICNIPVPVRKITGD